MPVARVTELSGTSEQSFEDAINQAINRATSTLRNVEGAHVKDMNVLIENGNITGYKANLEIVFVLDEGDQPARLELETPHKARAGAPDKDPGPLLCLLAFLVSENNFTRKLADQACPV